ncbi:MAG: hypothetical protein ABEJ82_08535 [Haloplanus sp.]
MAKVSIGLRGWRFEESAVFTDDGEFRPLDEIPEDPRERLVRLSYLVEQPCDACYLVHGETGVERCNAAAIVYGEPGAEVVLCDDHEADFLYWYREAGGKAHRGEASFRDSFHEWFADGGRAPEGYAGLDHVDTDPDSLPDPPDPQEVQRRLEANFEGEVIDLRDETDREAETDADADPVETDGLDLGADYPSK